MHTPLLLVIFTAVISALVHFGNANYFRGDPKLDFDSPYYVQLNLWFRGGVGYPTTTALSDETSNSITIDVPLKSYWDK
jgi:hypothetical protein